MDTFTHALVGAILAQAFFARRLGRLAPLIGALAAILPDIDRVMLLLADDTPSQKLAAMAMLDGMTHAIIFIPLWAVLAAIPFYWLPALRYRRKFIFLGALTAAASHGVLDVCASQGTAIFWPVWDNRLAMDWVNWFDPILALLLIAGVIAGLIKHNPMPGRVTAGILLIYLGMGAAQHERAVAVQDQLARSRQHEPQRSRVMPAGGNLIVWRSMYEYNKRIHLDAIRIAPGFAPGSEPGYRAGLEARPVDIKRLPGNLEDSLQETQTTQFIELADGWAGFIYDRAGLDTPLYDFTRAYLPQGSVSPRAIQLDPQAAADAPVTWVHPPPPRQGLWRDHIRDAVTGESNGQPFVPIPPPARD